MILKIYIDMNYRLIKCLLILVVVMATILSCKKENKGLEERLKGHVAYLTSEECDGRESFTIYAYNAVKYIAEQMKEIGLLPYREEGEDDYLQQVKLVKININAPEKLTINGDGWDVTMTKDEDFTLVTQDTVTVDFKDCELIFAGYGIVAPEYGKNDYEGIDNPANKIALVIINDPGLDDPDSSYFCGNEMTYYGRWTYKMEEGARQGLAGVMIIHNDRGAGYSWNVAKASSIVFLAPTCEEKGMYGSKHHANHPMFPLEKARAIVNMDVLPLWGKSKTLTITGYGHYPDMDAFVAEIAEKHGRKVVSDPESYNGMFYRSDQLPFMQKGVTPLFAKGWEEKDGRIENYWKNVYHTPNDKMNDWDDYSGLAEEVELFVDIIWELAN